MMHFSDLIEEFRGINLRWTLKNGQQIDAVLEDLLFEEQVDKKGNKVDTLWGVKVIFRGRRAFWRLENIDDFEEVIEEE